MNHNLAWLNLIIVKSPVLWYINPWYFFLIAYWWILLFYLFSFLVHKGLGIVWLPMTHVCGYAFIHGLEAVWKLRFSWKMNVHCCEVHLGEYYVFNFSCALWWSKLWINALTGESPSSGSFKFTWIYCLMYLISSLL